MNWLYFGAGVLVGVLAVVIISSIYIIITVIEHYRNGVGSE